MKRAGFIETVQRRVAVVAIGPSTLRGQIRGTVAACREFLASLPLEQLPASSAGRFQDWLDRQTEDLLDQLPASDRPWGAARKALNIFLRDSLYNQYLNASYGLDRAEPWLEIPLDSAVARGFGAAAGQHALPQWPGVKHLTREVSDEYQRFAAEHACSLGVARVNLDMYLWLENR